MENENLLRDPDPNQTARVSQVSKVLSKEILSGLRLLNAVSKTDSISKCDCWLHHQTNQILEDLLYMCMWHGRERGGGV